MDDAIQVIKQRRSIRNYKPEQMPDADLQTIVECGFLAPSAMNQQTAETDGWAPPVVPRPF